MSIRTLFIVVSIAATSSIRGTVEADVFHFSSGQNGLAGLASATVSGGEFQLVLTAGPEGALLNDIDAQGLGINSQPVSGQDDDTTKFNLISGPGPFVGQGERLSFSFDRAGLVTGLNFDGVKDETLEYFLLEMEGLDPIYFFDSQADRKQIKVNGEVVFLLEDKMFDDEIVGLEIPFLANQEMTITYGQLLDGNGSRFEGLTVEVPEPSGLILVLAVCVVALSWRSRLGDYSCSPNLRIWSEVNLISKRLS